MGGSCEFQDVWAMAVGLAFGFIILSCLLTCIVVGAIYSVDWLVHRFGKGGK